jgi:DNA (cytosine-5)-methyltransferase 1
METPYFNAIDLFSGCGGLSEGLRLAGFKIVAGVEIDPNAARTYRLNHPDTFLFEDDIRKLSTGKIQELLNSSPLHLLAGCPPCQGFSSIRKLNRKAPVYDERNKLILEYYRFIEKIQPLTVMMENVPGLMDYVLFKKVVFNLEKIGYSVEYKVVDIARYGVPQRRKRLVLIGSRIGRIKIVDGSDTVKTVRDTIGSMQEIDIEKDELHKIYPKHSPRIQRMISLVPKNGGGRMSLPDEYILDCHRKKNVGFNDVYGRLWWDRVSSTITGGCLNPSKGRFLHPIEDRCITAREAALLQTFPMTYKFPINIPISKLALLIGNALPPSFSKIHAESIIQHIVESYG